jgi:hypothetical protein
MTHATREDMKEVLGSLGIALAVNVMFFGPLYLAYWWIGNG